ncbi:predicted esterase of the alpha/beta hydrolase fold [Microbacterium testaceum StLB037]|uniref:Predicted esterase of the alpha/beta hydrolase fold n=2 Tax=Microbacterium testaceum TaxID=2033 RepID=E8NGB5_MICTS|nr:predicted esterase of the alpha/beta hydrolase fold [Microbacterium testaceum StLB037]
MVAYVIVPGIGGSGEQHWQTRWERRWRDAAVRVAPRSWDEPELEDWVDAVDRAVTDRAGSGDEVILVAHSLGCWAAAGWEARPAHAEVAGMLLVAPPDPDGDVFPRAAASSFVGVEVRPLSCRSVVVASSDDPYCPIEVAERFASGWGSAFRDAGGLGHLNTASGLDEWEWGRTVLAELVRE